MPLAKTAPQPVVETPQETQVIVEQKTTAPDISYSGVPLDLYRYFNLDLGTVNEKEVSRLKDILTWAKQDTQSLGDAMVKISHIERELGMGGFEKRHERVWNWVRLSLNINDLEARRESLRKENGR